ncbi:hypothetical protein J7L02_01020 [Candidatus Woesearchaeota archaeon]|nr:hypothetical protein [Candidatus Woesearchaeota archaeon]
MAKDLYQLLESLVKEYGFKKVKNMSKLPTIDFVYPNTIQDGNTESFRFDDVLRMRLAKRSSIVKEQLAGKKIAYTSDEDLLLEVSNIIPRLGLKELINNEINSVYAYKPLVFIAADEKEFVAYVVKPIVDYSMVWFELTPEETQALQQFLTEKAASGKSKTNEEQGSVLTYIKRVFGKLLKY